MSFAIHIFLVEKFAKESYRRFLGEAQTLYGTWFLEDLGPVEETGINIHDCFLKSENLPPGENVRVNVRSGKQDKAIKRGFDYEWCISFETNAGRSPLSLAVQLGTLLLAMQKFQWSVVLDRDTCVEGEPTEFRSKEAVIEHLRRIMQSEFGECSRLLARRGITREDGFLLMPGKSRSS